MIEERKLKEKEFSRSIYKPVKEYKDYLKELTSNGLSIIDLDWDITEDSVDLGEEYGLLTSDAFHVAAIKRNGIFHVATNDSDFDNIDFITVWKPQGREIKINNDN